MDELVGRWVCEWVGVWKRNSESLPPLVKRFVQYFGQLNGTVNVTVRCSSVWINIWHRTSAWGRGGTRSKETFPLDSLTILARVNKFGLYFGPDGTEPLKHDGQMCTVAHELFALDASTTKFSGY